MEKKSTCSMVKNKTLAVALFWTILTSSSLAAGVGLNCKKDHEINRKKNAAMVLAIVLGIASINPTIKTWKLYKELYR